MEHSQPKGNGTADYSFRQELLCRVTKVQLMGHMQLLSASVAAARGAWGKPPVRLKRGGSQMCPHLLAFSPCVIMTQEDEPKAAEDTSPSTLISSPLEKQSSL